jgi:glutathione reductase (NADPH)
MYNLANFLEEAQVLAGYGVEGLENIKLNFSTLKKQRDAYIKRLNDIYHTNVKNSNIDYFEGTARFVS